MEKPIFIFIFFLSALILSAFFTFPKYQEVMNLKSQIEAKRTVLQYKEDRLLQLKDLEEKLEYYKEPLEKLDSALPKDPDLPNLFNFLEKTALENGLILGEISSFTVSPPKTKEQLGQASVTFSLSGSYSSFKNFLDALEKSARLITLENLSFSSPEEGETFNFDLIIKVSFYSW